MIKKIISSILVIKPIKLLVFKFINKGKSLVVKSEFVNLKTNIGNNVIIMEGSVTDHLTNIGDYCYIGRYCYLTKVNIGNYCSIANNVSIGQGEHDLNKISTNSIFYENTFDELTKKECEIGNDVWIGVDSIIRRGIKIGNGAVIGANSVVTKDVPPYAIVAGSPAKIIRYRFEQEKIELIENSKWWSTPPLRSQKHISKIGSKMIKASFYLNFYLRNKVFDINDIHVNRDNYAYSYFKLKDVFLENGMDLSTYDINSINESKIVIYNDMPKVLPNKEDINKSYLLLFESELIKPNNWDLEKHKYFNKIFTWDDRIIDNKKYFKINFSHLFPESINKDLSKKEKLCTLIAGNKRVNHPLELYSKRVEAIRWFEKNYPLDFDFYGMGWDEYTPANKYIRYGFRKLKLSKLFQLLKPNFPSYKGKVDSKKEVLEKYKFAICYENARDIDGYITEKIFDCFFAGCVPIYWGANNIIEHIPKECFIDKREFDSYEKLYEFITNITHEEYLKYLDAIENYLNSSKADEFRAEYFANTIVETILNDIR